jgi:hypothetical protein
LCDYPNLCAVSFIASVYPKSLPTLAADFRSRPRLGDIMPDIKYARPTECQSLGKSGYCVTVGIATSLLRSNNVDEIHFEPITTRGVGRGRIVVGMDAVPELIATLQAFQNKCRRGAVVGTAGGPLSTSYQIDWRINLDAEDTQEAARKALQIQRDPESIATVFLVTDLSGRSEVVDLLEADEDEGLSEADASPVEP